MDAPVLPQLEACCMLAAHSAEHVLVMMRAIILRWYKNEPTRRTQ